VPDPWALATNVVFANSPRSLLQNTLPTIVQTLLGHLMGTTGKTLEKSLCLQFVRTLVALEKSSIKV
jgi:hypothetical protein